MRSVSLQDMFPRPVVPFGGVLSVYSSTFVYSRIINDLLFVCSCFVSELNFLFVEHN